MNEAVGKIGGFAGANGDLGAFDSIVNELSSLIGKGADKVTIDMEMGSVCENPPSASQPLNRVDILR